MTGPATKADPTAPERVARYEDRMRRAGFAKVHLQVPADRVDEIKAIAAQMRAAARGETED